MSYFKKLNEFFDSTGLTQTEIGEKTGYSQVMIGRYLKRNKPNLEFIQKVNKAFSNIDWNYILKNNGNELSEPEEVYEKSPEMLIKEIEVRLNKLSDWHKSDTEKK
jgi:transcriptional regulator with XRE-family HTH domain